jgi:hypothetical protein
MQTPKNLNFQSPTDTSYLKRGNAIPVSRVAKWFPIPYLRKLANQARPPMTKYHLRVHWSVSALLFVRIHFYMQFTFNEFKKGTVGKLQTLFLFGI